MEGHASNSGGGDNGNSIIINNNNSSTSPHPPPVDDSAHLSNLDHNYRNNLTLDDSSLQESTFPPGDSDSVDDGYGSSELHYDPRNRTALEETEMHRRLMDVESSFLPEPSAIDVGIGGGGDAAGAGADDTYLMGAGPLQTPQQDRERERERERDWDWDQEQEQEQTQGQDTDDSVMHLAHLQADADADADPYRTPVPHRAGQDDVPANTSALETISSPPTVAAARRTVSKVLSDTFSSADMRQQLELERERDRDRDRETAGLEDTQRRNRPQPRNVSFSSEVAEGAASASATGATLATAPSERRRKRPKFLTSRQSGHRLSASSTATANTDATSSDVTTGLGVDYALQTGGAAPDDHDDGSLRPERAHRTKEGLVRSSSLGSLASGLSGLSDDASLGRRTFSGGLSDANLHTLNEEEVASQPSHAAQDQDAGEEEEGDGDGEGKDDAAAPMTPKARARDAALFPGDTVTTQRYHNPPAATATATPSTSIRQPFRDSNLESSPGKHAGGASTSTSTPGFSRGKHMTLKEQSSTIDRLSKENFDLKMRIHFLNEALSKRSEEGIQEMVSENVELKSDKLKLQKDNQSLRRAARELERQLKDRGEKERDQGSSQGDKDENASDGERAAMEEELIYLRERIESYETETERLRSESVARENEKRKMAEMVKSLGEGRVSAGSDAGAREERVSGCQLCFLVLFPLYLFGLKYRLYYLSGFQLTSEQDMWKDMLDAETAAREQAEEESRKLREELAATGSTDQPSRVSQHGRMSQASQPLSDRNFDRTAVASSSSSKTLVELELLKQENAELRREVSAQASMLTSRNREKERLYQEIEDLKLTQGRSDGRSAAGDSILERSASRAAENRADSSRVSEGTRAASHFSDAEREGYEVRTGELRDHVSTLKLENQTLRAEVDEYTAELETIDRAYQEELGRVEDDMQNVQMEREYALRVADEREAELQDLKAEAQEEIDALGGQVEEKDELCQRLEVDVKNQEENLNALQAELRSASEGILRLEEDAQSNLQKYKTVQDELDAANRELETMENNLSEANSKNQRLTVQQESSQNEIAFLREEQDADKIRIGDLESEMKTTQTSLQSERDRAKELDQRLAEERHQREVVDNKEKQQVQRMMNELNRESSTSKDEVRKLKKSLSARENEASTWKERLLELENNLRETLGDLNGTRSSLLTSITKLQKELESTSLELESTRSNLDEKEALLRNRDSLLESHGLETRKLSDLLERERQAHRADKHSFEQSLKSHSQASRTIAQNNSRITELENARSHDRKRFGNVEQQYKDQLNERNTAFLTLWKRLSALCGPDWAHSNSLINGNLPSQEVIGNVLFWPGFNKNLMLAVKTVENLINGCKTRIKSVERDLTKEYQGLEQNLGARLKKLDRLEESVVQIRANRRPTPSKSSDNDESSKLKRDVRLLKAEINLLRSHSRAQASAPSSGAAHARSDPQSNKTNDDNNDNDNNNNDDTTPRGGSSAAASGIPRPSGLSPATATPTPSTPTVTSPTQPQPGRSSSSDTGGALTTQAPFYPPSHNVGSGGSAFSQEKWIQRLRELERRLKAEREARLLDRSGARKRLEERNAENEELKAQLEREKLKSRHPPPPPQQQKSGGGGSGSLVGSGTAGGGGSRARRGQAGSTTDRRSGNGGSTRKTNNNNNHNDDHERDNDDDAGSGQMVVIQRRGGYGHEQSDSYDGEDDYDEGAGTGTDDGEGLTVEVEV